MGGSKKTSYQTSKYQTTIGNRGKSALHMNSDGDSDDDNKNRAFNETSSIY